MQPDADALIAKVLGDVLGQTLVTVVTREVRRGRCVADGFEVFVCPSVGRIRPDPTAGWRIAVMQLFVGGFVRPRTDETRLPSMLSHSSKTSADYQGQKAGGNHVRPNCLYLYRLHTCRQSAEWSRGFRQ